MGNSSSIPAREDFRLEGSNHSSKSCSSWAKIDHTNSGPWGFLVKEHVQCLCEGGRSCTREDPARQKGSNAVPGLHSNWVGQQVLAMARPWQEHIAKYDLVSRFQELDIGMILNLQEVGEHDSCGPGNLPSCGFTYSPEAFMAARIGFYNLSWRDMGVPTLDKMMDIVQVMHYTTAVEKKRIAVHCHAGLGRTGLAIACFYVAIGQATAVQAVEMVRQDRPGALQTSAQVLFVSIFEQYLQHLRCLFKVADLKQLSLGNEGFILTKVCRRISRSLSAHGQGAADPLAAATAALSTISITGTPMPALPAAATAAAAPASASGVKAAARLDSGRQARVAPGGLQDVAESQSLDDWVSVDYSALEMTPSEAAAVPSAAEAAANAALNLGPGSGAGEGMVMHARRLSGGGTSMKLVCNLKAIKEEKDKPVHVIETESAVTEVYGHGLTIIRSAHNTKKLSTRKSTELAPSRRSLEERVMDRLPTEKDLGLDRQLPWNEKFHIRPEAFSAEAWLPEAPGSYLEALRRQQRLLHGLERRQSLRLHRLLKAAAKALTKASRSYNEVPAHQDAPPRPAAAADSPGAGALLPPSPLKRYHSRSRSMAAAADLLALNVGSGSFNGGAIGGLAGSSSSHSLPGTPNSKAGAGAAGLMLGLMPGSSSNGSPAGTCGAAGNASAAAGGGAVLPGGIHLGAPGTSPVTSGLSTRNSSSGGTGPGTGPSGSSCCDASTAAAVLGIPSLGSSQCCLAGCCAPSFAAGLLVALLFKGRFPEEYEAAWSSCPRVQGLGLGEGHVFCEQLQCVKLALNGGDFGPLEGAPAAVAAVVLCDWFESFSSEALTEGTLGLLIDEAEELLGQSNQQQSGTAAAAALAGDQQHAADMQQQQQQQCGSSGEAGAGGSGKAGGVLQDSRHSFRKSSSGKGKAARGQKVGSGQPQQPLAARPAAVRFAGADDDGALDELQDDELTKKKAAARAFVCALVAHEQDLFLCLAAVLRHTRLASLDDSRLPAGASPGRRNSGSTGGAAAGGAAGGAGAGDCLLSPEALQQQVDAVQAEVEAVMRALYRMLASWLLGPLAVACSAALDATAAFLQYLATDDTGYMALLQASREQGMKKSHSQPALLRGGSGSHPDSPGPGLTSSQAPRGDGSGSPRSQLRARIMAGPLDTAACTPAAAPAAGHGKKSKLGQLGHAAFSSPALSDLSGGTKAPRTNDFFLPARDSSELAGAPLPATAGAAAAAAKQAAGASGSGALAATPSKAGSSKGLVEKIAQKLHVKPKAQLGGLRRSKSSSSTGSRTSSGCGEAACKGASKIACADGLPTGQRRQQQQQQQQPLRQLQQSGCQVLPESSTCGDAVPSHDSSSQLMLQGQRGLCVGVQRGKSNATHMEAELAVLSGRQGHEQQQPGEQAECSTMMQPLHQGSWTDTARQTGQSDTAPAAAATAAAAEPAPSSPGSRAARQQPVPPPGCPLLPSTSPRLSGISRPASCNSSPPSSCHTSPGGHLAQLSTSTMLQRIPSCSAADAAAAAAAGAALPSAGPTGPAPIAECSAMSYVSTFSTGVGAVGQGAACSNSLDVTASQLLSLSAMSDLQLPSFASTVSVAESLVVAQSRQSWERR